MANILELPPAGAHRPTPQGFEHARAPIRASSIRTSPIRTSEVYVVFTSVAETLTALSVGSKLAGALGVPLILVHLRTVPYATAMDGPNGCSPIEMTAIMDRLRETGVDVQARVYLCRTLQQAIPAAFRRTGLIVVGGRRSWWPTRAERWRRALEAAGHFVVFVDTSEHGSRVPSRNGPGWNNARKERAHA